MVAVLLADVTPRLLPAFFLDVNKSHPFPEPWDLDPGTYCVRIDFPDDCWVSNGIYLIPSILASVERVRPAILLGAGGDAHVFVVRRHCVRRLRRVRAAVGV
jgi:hypothetical protein